MSPTIVENRIIGIVGPKGSGKTHRAARQFAKEKRAFMYQPARMNSECDAYATHISEGDLKTVFEIMEKADPDPESPDYQFRIVYKVPDADFVRRGQNLIYLTILPVAQECYYIGNMTLYMDEAHELCNQETIDPELRRVVRLARNNQLNITWCSQSMEVHREIRRNTDELVLYRMWEPGDLDKIRRKCGESTAETVKNLRRLKKGPPIEPGEFVVWCVEFA